MKNLAPEYGRGKKADLWWSSCMAAISFLLGSILIVWAGYALYFILQPQTGGDWGGLGAFLSRLGVFVSLAVATPIVGPLGFLLGLGASTSLKKDADWRISTLLARLGMVSSLLVMGFVATGYVILSR